jgi:hypothetical protein
MAVLNNTFYLIEFEDGLQIVPDDWIQKDTKKCWYPNFEKDKNINKAIKNGKYLTKMIGYYVHLNECLVYMVSKRITRILSLLSMYKRLFVNYYDQYIVILLFTKIIEYFYFDRILQ